MFVADNFLFLSFFFSCNSFFNFSSSIFCCSNNSLIILCILLFFSFNNSFLIASIFFKSLNFCFSFSFSLSLYIFTAVIFNISGFIKSFLLNLFPNSLIISSGIVGLCSINLSSSVRHLLINSVPLIVLSSIGNESSTDIFLENLEYEIPAALWPSNSSLTLRNCDIVVIKPAVRLRKPIQSGT